MGQGPSFEYDRLSTIRWSGPDGQLFVMREVTCTDVADLKQLARDLSPAARYFRFGRFNIADLGDEQIKAICDGDSGRAAHWIVHAQDGVDLTPVANARYVATRSDPKQTEILMLITDRWQKCGIGRQLLARLSQCARAHDFESLCAQVLPTNQPMQTFLVSQGFDPVVREAGRPIVYVKKLI
ncbi:hypothetical protein DBV39_06710 [Orrella marina]|uniref:N-acetyltransferase domain-containing protein n=1 Tax=Orrella marina TaxID=2163011 RepID=A0A2R4XI99_9BURK|nr:hypothetical protein DBV39_06710 [Orrella marina]